MKHSGEEDPLTLSNNVDMNLDDVNSIIFQDFLRSASANDTLSENEEVINGSASAYVEEEEEGAKSADAAAIANVIYIYPTDAPPMSLCDTGDTVPYFTAFFLTSNPFCSKFKFDITAQRIITIIEQNIDEFVQYFKGQDNFRHTLHASKMMIQLFEFFNKDFFPAFDNTVQFYSVALSITMKYFTSFYEYNDWFSPYIYAKLVVVPIMCEYFLANIYNLMFPLSTTFYLMIDRGSFSNRQNKNTDE